MGSRQSNQSCRQLIIKYLKLEPETKKRRKEETKGRAIPKKEVGRQSLEAPEVPLCTVVHPSLHGGEQLRNILHTTAHTYTVLSLLYSSTVHE